MATPKTAGSAENQRQLIFPSTTTSIPTFPFVPHQLERGKSHKLRAIDQGSAPDGAGFVQRAPEPFDSHSARPARRTQNNHWLMGWIVRTVMAVSLLIGFSAFSVVMNSSAPTDSAAAM
jgi:hypothetical protein